MCLKSAADLSTPELRDAAGRFRRSIEQAELELERQRKLIDLNRAALGMALDELAKRGDQLERTDFGTEPAGVSTV